MMPESEAIFQPVATLADLDALDDDDIVAGYRDFRSGDPEPGLNRGRAYWHGWRNAARDQGQIESWPESSLLAKAWMMRERARRHD